MFVSFWSLEMATSEHRFKVIEVQINKTTQKAKFYRYSMM